MQNKKYYVFNKNGLLKTFIDYDKFLYFVLTKGSSCFGNSFKDFRWRKPAKFDLLWGFSEPSEFKRVEYVAYDSNMTLIPCKILDKIVNSHNNKFLHKGSLKKSKKKFAYESDTFRKTPISGLIKDWKYYNILRNPKTSQELKENVANKQYSRGKRRNIPTSYSDIVRSDRLIEHSWKKNKKRKQWM